MARQQRSKRRKSLAERAVQTPMSEEQLAEQKLKECGQKKRFKFKGDAERLAAEYGLGVYQCHFCGGWHFTSR